MSGDNHGRVEVCSNGEWEAVCGDRSWDDIDAGVICKQLGFSQQGNCVKVCCLHGLNSP